MSLARVALSVAALDAADWADDAEDTDSDMVGKAFLAGQVIIQI
jgi:hypothetical protein